MAVSLEYIERLHLGLLVAAAAGAFATAWVSPWSLILGGAVMGVNFWLMRQMARWLLSGARRRRPALVAGLLLGKFSLFMGMLALLFWRVPIDAIGFGVGATLLLVACVVAAVRQQRAVA